MRFHHQSGVFTRRHTSSTSRRGGLEVMALLRWSGSESYLRLPKSESRLEVSAVRTYRIRNCKARNNFVCRPVQYGPPRESPTIIGMGKTPTPTNQTFTSETTR